MIRKSDMRKLKQKIVMSNDKFIRHLRDEEDNEINTIIDWHFLHVIPALEVCNYLTGESRNNYLYQVKALYKIFKIDIPNEFPKDELHAPLFKPHKYMQCTLDRFSDNEKDNNYILILNWICFVKVLPPPFLINKDDLEMNITIGITYMMFVKEEPPSIFCVYSDEAFVDHAGDTFLMHYVKWLKLDPKDFITRNNYVVNLNHRNKNNKTVGHIYLEVSYNIKDVDDSIYAANHLKIPPIILNKEIVEKENSSEMIDEFMSLIQ